jgi:hypothetical protein
MKLREESAVVAVQPKRMADLVHGDRQQVDAICGVARCIAEHPAGVEPPAIQIDSFGRVAQVFGIVARGRIDEEASMPGSTSGLLLKSTRARVMRAGATLLTKPFLPVQVAADITRPAAR